MSKVSKLLFWKCEYTLPNRNTLTSNVSNFEYSTTTIESSKQSDHMKVVFNVFFAKKKYIMLYISHRQNISDYKMTSMKLSVDVTICFSISNTNIYQFPDVITWIVYKSHFITSYVEIFFEN
jgi:hypothetical protein